MTVPGTESDGRVEVVRPVEYGANSRHLPIVAILCTKANDGQLAEHVVDEFRLITKMHNLTIRGCY